MIISEIVVHFVLCCVTIVAESCTWFRSSENVAVGPQTCQMETSVTPDMIQRCLDECDRSLEVQ